MLINLLLILIALLILTAGAEGLVRGSSSLALRLGLTPLVVGLTVVAFGTSSPELVVSIKSSLAGQGNIAVGNVIGSNIFNIAVILGLTALITPVPVKVQLIKIDAPIMVGITILFPLLIISNSMLMRWEGLLLVGGLIAYMIFTVLLAKREATANWQPSFEEGVPSQSRHWGLDLLFIAGGLALLIYGSQLLVDNCITIAQTLGVSEAIIGLTIVAAGTSMPELATSIVAAVRKQPDLAIGNIVGSNIFNVLSILGIAATVNPIAADGIRIIDYVVMIGISILLLPVIRSGGKLSRIEGTILLLCYAGYMVYLWPK